ncbi:MAG TPA: hypothetical protein VFI17_04130 [Solirubrobacterales bacterium]|nr:hypothetical protein [Solirubrobacterales bacterium]
MTRIKVLGVALVAIFAMGALASSAMAVSGIEFEEPTNMPNGKVMGEQKGTDTFTVDGSNVTCNIATYNKGNTIPNGTTTTTLHPVYSSCTAFGFIGAEINTGNCDYEGMAGGNYEEANMKWNSGEIIINCSTTTGEPNSVINISAGTCVASVGPQTISSGIHFTNTTANQNGDGRMDFDLVATNASVTVEKTADGFGCPFNGTGMTNGTYNGTTTFRCTNPNTDALTGCTVAVF